MCQCVFFYIHYSLTVVRKLSITSCKKLLCVSASYCMVLFHFQNCKISSLYGCGIKRIFQNANIECLGNSTPSLRCAEIANSHTTSRAVHWLLLQPCNHVLEEESNLPEAHSLPAVSITFFLGYNTLPLPIWPQHLCLAIHLAAFISFPKSSLSLHSHLQGKAITACPWLWLALFHRMCSHH